MLDPIVLILLALGAYRLTRLIVEDTIFEPVRTRIWKKYPPETTKLGYWFTCYWCAGFAMSVLMVGLYLVIPVVAIPIAAILSISAVIGILDHLMTK